MRGDENVTLKPVIFSDFIVMLREIIFEVGRVDCYNDVILVSNW